MPEDCAAELIRTPHALTAGQRVSNLDRCVRRAHAGWIPHCRAGGRAAGRYVDVVHHLDFLELR
jgi:hypothetical protein